MQGSTNYFETDVLATRRSVVESKVARAASSDAPHTAACYIAPDFGIPYQFCTSAAVVQNSK